MGVAQLHMGIISSASESFYKLIEVTKDPAVHYDIQKAFVKISVDEGEPIANMSEMLLDDPLGGKLQAELNRAREKLSGVEENLHQLLGPVPAPAPQEFNDSGAFDDDLKRETGLNQEDHRVGNFAGLESGFKRPFNAVFAAVGGSDEYRKTRGFGGDAEPPFKRRVRDEEEVAEKKPTLSSSVVKTGNEARTREEAIRNGERDTRTNARNRRMFGCLLGTLRQFQREETELKTKEEKRAQVEKKVEEKSKLERERMNQEKRNLIFDRRKQQQEIRRIEFKLHRLQEVKEWETQQKLLRNFIKTSASPPLYYLPKMMSEATEKMLEASRKEIDDMVAEKHRRLEEEFEKVDARAEARAEREMSMNMHASWRRSAGKQNDDAMNEEDGIFADDSHAKLAESLDEIMGIQAQARKAEGKQNARTSSDFSVSLKERGNGCVRTENRTRTSGGESSDSADEAEERPKASVKDEPLLKIEKHDEDYEYEDGEL
ncbi:unnamed protein product [Notodromas monacha]|uniref:Pinin/SDK/MemA protein domain-containing protein n=1 Tax=Notodromas monacha TaxID=399045 RepID=A0A7R9BJF6_9CRUS|nr:unnamed protein product [Notodromas monacha]CAG0916584.1 unnamed protein product [Notodromas monacha]